MWRLRVYLHSELATTAATKRTRQGGEKEAATMDASSWLESRSCGSRTHAGVGGGGIALDVRRQAAIRRILDRDGLRRTRELERDALSAAVLTERDLADVDYAGGSGY
jgi:hypothetical protein